MATKGRGWKFLAVVFTAVLLVSGAWVKAADAADITLHQLTVKDEMGKPLAGATCLVSAADGEVLSSGVTSQKGLISFYGQTGATVTCYGMVEVYKGTVKAGPKHIITKKQSRECHLHCVSAGGPCFIKC